LIHALNVVPRPVAYISATFVARHNIHVYAYTYVSIARDDQERRRIARNSTTRSSDNVAQTRASRRVRTQSRRRVFGARSTRCRCRCRCSPVNGRLTSLTRRGSPGMARDAPTICVSLGSDCSADAASSDFSRIIRLLVL
jgi:hypothetical protein